MIHRDVVLQKLEECFHLIIWGLSDGTFETADKYKIFQWTSE